MANKNRVGYEAFTRWELELAEGKAKGLIGKHGFMLGDYDDLKQDLLLQIYMKRETRAGWVEKTASAKTVMSRILDNRVRDIIDASHTDTRKVHLFTDSLQAPASARDEDARGQMIDEESIFRRMERSGTPEDRDLSMDIHNTFRDLNAIQRRVCDLLSEGQSISDISRILHIKRTTLNREIGRLRKIFYKRGLKAYI